MLLFTLNSYQIALEFPFRLLILIFASKIRKITKINSKFFKIDFRPAGQIN